jgi:hypothetical protein
MFEVKMIPRDPHWFLGLDAIAQCDRLNVTRDSRVTFVTSKHENLSLEFAKRFAKEFQSSRCVIFEYDVSDITAADIVSLRKEDETEICLREDLSESRLAELILSHREKHQPKPVPSPQPRQDVRFYAHVTIEPQALRGLAALEFCRRVGIPDSTEVDFFSKTVQVDELFAHQLADKYRYNTHADVTIDARHLQPGDVHVNGSGGYVAIVPDISSVRLYWLTKVSQGDEVKD